MNYHPVATVTARTRKAATPRTPVGEATKERERERGVKKKNVSGSFVRFDFEKVLRVMSGRREVGRK